MARTKELECVKYEIDDEGIAWVTFNRPEKRNAMNPKLHFNMQAVIAELETDDDAKVIQQISFIVNSVEDLKEYYLRLKEADVTIDRTVSHGNALGMYFFDPEGNRIEVFADIEMPNGRGYSGPIDLEKSKEELVAQIIAG